MRAVCYDQRGAVCYDRVCVGFVSHLAGLIPASTSSCSGKGLLSWEGAIQPVGSPSCECAVNACISGVCSHVNGMGVHVCLCTAIVCR